MAGNPKKVIDAFAAAGTKVSGVELREFTLGSMIVLEKIQSPLVAARKDGEKLTLSDLDLMRLVFILSRPSSESYTLLRDGMEEFDAAVMEFSDALSPAALPGIGAKIRGLFASAMSTAPSGNGVSESEKKTGRQSSKSVATGAAGS